MAFFTYCTRVILILFTPLETHGLLYAVFHETRISTAVLCVDLLCPFLHKSGNNTETTSRDSFTLLSKV